MAHGRPQSVADIVCDDKGRAATPSLNSSRDLSGRFVKSALNLEMEDTGILTLPADSSMRILHRQTQ